MDPAPKQCIESSVLIAQQKCPALFPPHAIVLNAPDGGVRVGVTAVQELLILSHSLKVDLELVP